MKLKITDEKLNELAKTKYINNHGFGFAGSENGFKDVFRAAEQFHQATIDKLMQIIEMQAGFVESIKRNTGDTNVWDLCCDELERTDKMMKELKETT